jgi:hypothetical protein
VFVCAIQTIILLEGGLKMRIKPAIWAKRRKTPCAQKNFQKWQDVKW